MAKELKSVGRPEPRPDAAELRKLAESADPTIPPAVMPRTEAR